ncbi:Importin N-terminal domain-containing protein [Citrus sinensis]|uniref:Importin N-terminal domain-containing protein n=1 Tax=Citrus sinensis TaxID=2711 RepID=A0ACB8IAF4_CITSI|nr:Importin N-terminal domain-containing protein [Citrus sinensis]
MDINQVAQLLNDTLSLDVNAVRTATDALDRLSLLPHFPFCLLYIASGGENQGLRIAAATYLKNLTRRNIDGNASCTNISKEFKDQLMRVLLQAEPSVLKVLLEAFRVIVGVEFVKQNSWPELVHELQSAIQSSYLISKDANSGWTTVNGLMVLHALIKPFQKADWKMSIKFVDLFRKACDNAKVLYVEKTIGAPSTWSLLLTFFFFWQYFLNPKLAKEPVPPQLELIAKEIIVPMLTIFHCFVEKVLANNYSTELDTEKILLIVCKCIFFSVKSHLPFALVPYLSSFCHDLIMILGSLSFDDGNTVKDNLLRFKTGKRSLLIFSALVTRHRKFSDKLMPDIMNSVLQIVKYSANISKLDFLQERIISLAFDVISHVLETGPGWRLVSPHFSVLLDKAIFPALVLNEKDISEWEEDADEYIRKNFPSELEEISGWREDLFTARKSAINLLGVISVSKGPPMGTPSNCSSVSSKRKKGEKSKRNSMRSTMGELLVLPFLSRFPIPCDANASHSRIQKDYFGVLMAYGGLQEFLREQKSEFTANLVRSRVLPLYSVSVCLPYLVASANWILGELASCLPEDISADVYSSLLKALQMLDKGDTSCYPVRASAAGAIVGLLENDYMPPEWYPLLQVIVGRIGYEDEENSILFELLSSVVGAANENVVDHIPYIVSSLVAALSKHMHPSSEPWPQVVERGFAALALMAQSWENFLREEVELDQSSGKWESGQAAIAKAFSALLQQAWLTHIQPLECEVSAPPSCIDDSSMLLRSIIVSVSERNVIEELKLSELLLVWADLIGDWHAWEETEDLTVFYCIKEIVNLHSKYELKNFIVRQMPPPPAPPVPPQSIIEGIGAFLSEAILQYPSATWRACSCVHTLLHVPKYSFETEGVKQSLTISFSCAAFSRFRAIQSKPSSLWKPVVLAISSCYLCYPAVVEGILKKDEDGGFALWGSALAFLCSSSFEPRLSLESEIKLAVLTLAKVVERLLGLGNPGSSLLRDCYASLMEAAVQLKEVQEEEENDEGDDEEAEDKEDDNEESEDDDEDSEGDECEETEEEFLERYAKAAVNLENNTLVEEGDVEDQEHDIELGSLDEVDQLKVVASSIERYHNVIMQGQTLSSQLISKFLKAYPQLTYLLLHS